MAVAAKPKHQWKGTDRHLVRKLQHTLLQMQNRDIRQAIFAGNKGVDPFYFAEGSTSAEAAAIETLLHRCDVVLLATT
jgi:hypothetical protein